MLLITVLSVSFLLLPPRYPCYLIPISSITKPSGIRASNVGNEGGFKPTPTFDKNGYLKNISLLPKIFAVLLPFATLPKLVLADESGRYVDKTIGYSLIVPPGWFVNAKKTPSAQITRYNSEQILFSATNFAEGSSMSVTQTNARQLLKDFDVEWWFAPFNKFSDLGSPELLAKLLILQRQGEFDKKVTASTILSSAMDDNIFLNFAFTSPLAESINRKTIAKSFYHNEKIYTIWLSGLTSVFDGEYAKQLYIFRDSFIPI
eukprot:gene6741-13657_t